jgi:DNA-binding protein HU-beta
MEQSAGGAAGTEGVWCFQDAWERFGISGQEMTMAERIETKAFIHQLALRMQTDDKVAATWLEATVETLYDTFKAGKGVTLTGLGGFYVQPRGKTWAFKFNPGQKLRALFGWSSSYKGPL